MISGPVISDQLAFRVSGDVYRSHTSTRMKGPVVGIRNLNPTATGRRGRSCWPSPRGAGAQVLTTYAHTHAKAPQGEVARPPFRSAATTTIGSAISNPDVELGDERNHFPIDRRLESRTTLSWGKSHFRRFAPEGFGQTQIHARDVSAESVVDWKPAGP